MKLTHWIPALAILTLGACSTDEAPSEAAIKAGQAAIEAAREEAVKYAPDELTKLETVLKNAQDKFQKKEFTAALTDARELAAKAQEMAKAASARKDELTRTWEDINLGLPGELERIGAHFENLGPSLPNGLDQAKLAEIKATFAGLGQQLQEARQAAQSGEIPKAVDMGSAARAKAVEIAQAIGVTEAQ